MIFTFGMGGAGDITEEELYEALKYSGLVTPDMTKEQMLEALGDYFPQYVFLFNMNYPTKDEIWTYTTTGTVQHNKDDGNGGWSVYTINGSCTRKTKLKYPCKYRYLTVRWELWDNDPKISFSMNYLGKTVTRTGNSYRYDTFEDTIDLSGMSPFLEDYVTISMTGGNNSISDILHVYFHN